MAVRRHVGAIETAIRALRTSSHVMRKPSPQIALLLGAGAAGLAILAYATSARRRGTGTAADPPAGTWRLPESRVGEPPLDTPKPVASDLFIVDSVLRGPLGLLLPVRMTIVRLPGGNLLLHSPTRLTPDLRRRLERMGRISHLVAPDSVHWTYLGRWQAAYPDAITWAAPGLRARRPVRRSGIRLDHDLGEQTPPDWPGLVLVIVSGALGFREAALFHQPTRTLILTDTVLNLHASQLPPAIRPVARPIGLVESGGKPPVYLRALLRLQRRSARRAIARLLDLQPERVIFAHGAWFRHDGTIRLRQAFRWLLPEGA